MDISVGSAVVVAVDVCVGMRLERVASLATVGELDTDVSEADGIFV
jgi:hypothetical protein